MSQGVPPLCFHCVHRRFEPVRGTHCAAFPEGIPEDIRKLRADHRRPLDGDHGIQFALREGAAMDLFEATVEILGERLSPVPRREAS